MIPKDLIMTQFTKERGESQNMASESYVFNPNFINQAPKTTLKPKAMSWSPEQVQSWFLSTLKLKQYETLFTDNQIEGEIFLDIGEMDFQELGMTVGIHRTKLLKAIEALKT